MRGDARPTLGRWERYFLIGLVATPLLAHLVQSGARGQLGRTLSGYDEQYYFAVVRSLVFDGDFDFRNEFLELTPRPQDVRPEIVPRTGRYANRYGVGWTIVALGPYVVVHGVLRAHGLIAGRFAWRGYEPPYQLAVAMAQIVAGGLGLVFAYLIARRFFPARACATAACLILIATPLLFYVVDEVYMSHAAGSFSVALFLHAAMKLAFERPNSRTQQLGRWATTGFAAALMAVTRYSNLVFAPAGVFAVTAVARRSEGWREVARGLGAALAAALPVLLLQLSLWHAVYGAWLEDPYGARGEGFQWLHPALYGYAFSHRNGLFFFSPVSLCGAVGLVGAVLARRARAARGLAAPMIVGAWALLYLNSAWHMWWFGSSFGARAYLEASAVLVFGLAFLFSTPSRRLQAVLYVTASAGTAWTILLWVLRGAGRLARDGATPTVAILEAIRDLLP
jgi:hypothetical protein